MNFSNYSRIGEFGLGKTRSTQNDPLSYCVAGGIQSGWSHSIGGGNSLVGPGSSQCQLYMAGYCSQNWTGPCEYMSTDKSTVFPNTVASCNNTGGSCDGPGIGNGMNQGDLLVYNTAMEKYLVSMSSNCMKKYEPFDPTVPDSPLIGRWVPSGQSCGGDSGISCNGNSNVCIGRYDVQVDGLDQDPVMNRLLRQPFKFLDILIKIYVNRRRNKTIHELKHTKLGRFYRSEEFQQIAKKIWG